ncbi:MAG: PAS domain-containing protein [Desulfotignum sp.]|nr:PAS domain-containing protein [Desulfotignum sp.]MCF8138648.1 PAS domain-containing protein [Desulfotignum sp.]
MNFRKLNQWMASASPWLPISMSFVLMAVIFFQTIMLYNREKQHVTTLLREKGTALITSFEADVRTGMPGSLAALHQFMEKTASHPDISYLFLKDGAGNIIARKARNMSGQATDFSAGTHALPDSGDPGWRIVETAPRTRYFEVYKTARFSLPDKTTHFRNLIKRTEKKRPVIVLGMDIAPFEQAAADDLHHNISMMAIVFLTGLTGVISLIWSRRATRSRRQLLDTRAFAAETIASLPMGVIIVDRDRHIRYINDTAGTLLDLNLSETIGAVAKDTLPHSIWHLHQTGVSPGKGSEQEIRVSSEKSGSTPVSVIVTRIVGRENDFIGFLFILKDLSHIRALESEIRRKEQQAALGTLASGIAHEVRNPLSSIKGYAGFFGSLFEEYSENKQAARMMVEEIDRVDRVITELLEFARPSDLELCPTQPEPLIRYSIGIVQHEAQSAGIRIIKKIDSPLPQVLLDPDRFTQVLLNLYLNAIQAMKHGGDLTVDVRVENDVMVFAVSDTGDGIAPQDLSSVFNPYYTTKKNGTGLGLAIAHKIIESHNGTIRLDSVKGKGTTFFILIPLENRKKE